MIDEKELRYGINRWCESGIITFAQGQRILASELMAELEPHTRPESPTHTSLHQLFEDVRAFVRQHPGATVLSADDPMTRSLGWTAYKIEGDVEHSQLFMIGLRHALADLAHDDVLRSEMSHSAGRSQIAARLMADTTKPI